MGRERWLHQVQPNERAGAVRRLQSMADRAKIPQPPVEQPVSMREDHIYLTEAEVILMVHPDWVDQIRKTEPLPQVNLGNE